jgi:phosphoribosyl-AMP cyclohydrolase/phosphoribosyl-ATP pyrophosphohydrolase/imidazole glycerol phosphate synthase subunit HisF
MNTSEETQIPKIPIIINGNDGTGKTTLVKHFNLHNDKYIMLERSSINTFNNITEADVTSLDVLTLDYTWKESRTKEFSGDQPYRFILDLPPSVIDERIKNRPDEITKWDEPRSIRYFSKRFKELSHYYGFPLIQCENKTTEQIIDQIIYCIESGEYEAIRYLKLNTINKDFLDRNDIENILINKHYVFFAQHHEKHLDKAIMDFEKNNIFNITNYKDMSYIIFIRWFIKNSLQYHINGTNKYMLKYEDMKIEIQLDHPHLIKFCEGESKIVYKVLSKYSYFNEKVIITLKPTIYSHSMQATGEIKDLEKIRAQGTMIFTEMLNRNDVNHSYLSINSNGIIVSKLMETNQLEIIFKRYCEGTDKHSYYEIKKDRSIVLENGEYTNSMYIRFDWRNPNHVINGSMGVNVNESDYYYLIEKYEGKQLFFDKYLSKNNDLNITPYGDKTLSSDILENLVNVKKIKESVIKIYSTIESYLNGFGIEAKDGCFMVDSSGECFWSEINQDCMRLKTLESNVSYDKDIWRVGGSSNSSLILDKWKDLNNTIITYFESNPFMEEIENESKDYSYVKVLNRFLSNPKYKISEEYTNIYKKLIEDGRSITRRQNHNGTKRMLLTLDLYDRKPVIVRQGKVSESHADNVNEAFEKISLYPDILMVDLNGAIDKNNKVNRDIIKNFGKSNYIHNGGGIHTIEDVQDILSSSVRRVVISSNTEAEFINEIPKERLIVELSINEHFEVLIDGRKTNTHIKIKQKLQSLSDLGVESVSITFQNTEGMCNGIPKSMIEEIVKYIPRKIKKIYIAGGISTIDDVNYLWSFPKLIPQLGSAIWKNMMSMGELYCAMAKWDRYGLLSCVIQNINGVVLGVVYMNDTALQKTCDSKLLYRYSRQFEKVMCKGDTSGNYQKVIKMSFDCDNDSLLVIVEDMNSFCHAGNTSCFSNQTVIKANMSNINSHIVSRNEHNSYYVHKLKKYPELSLLKIMEEFWEVLSNTNVNECSDFLIHFVIYLNSMNINWNDICNELNSRKWDPKLIKTRQEKKNLVMDVKKIYIGITVSKYINKTYNFLELSLGIKVKNIKGRQLKVEYDIIDMMKYNKYFQNKIVCFVNMKPKDMPSMISSGSIDGTVTYSSVIMNQPNIFNTVCEAVDNDIEMSLIKRKDDIIDQTKWTPTSKCYIICEHVVDVYNYMTQKLGVTDDSFSIVRVSGSSESFMVNESKTHFTFADAIIETGSTIKENNLEVWKLVIPKGEIKIGLYISKMFS